MIILSVFPISENMTFIPELFTLAGAMTTGVLGFAIWILAMFATFAITSGFKSADSFIASTFVGFFVALILWVLELLAFEFVINSVLLFLAALVFTKMARGGFPA